MSFYGDIKRVNSSPFIFDKIYPNRVEMETQMESDNIYIGRYVLVKYTTKYADSTKTDLVYFNKFEKDPESETGKRVTQDYQENADVDINEYSDTYDATIWQKIYTTANGETQPSEKYILIAEANAAVPRLELNITSPKYYDDNVDEQWTDPRFIPEASSEDAYTFKMPNILHLDVGDMDEDFYAKPLISDPSTKVLLKRNPDPNDEEKTTYYSSEALSHEEMLSDEHNYMRWTNIYYPDGDTENPTVITQPSAGQAIDGKKLDTQLYAFGQLISDLYDALYGAPENGEGGPRPFYTDDLAGVLQDYDKGLVGILSSIATDSKGDGSQDLYARHLNPGMYYYFITKWNDAEEDSTNFIENIPKVIGRKSDGAAYSHYWVNFNSPSTNPDGSYNYLSTNFS